MSKVVSIVYKPEGRPDLEDQYLRIPLDSAKLIVGYGIEGDRKGGNPKRNLNIMSFETLEALRKEGFNTQPGQMGEQLVIQGLNMGKLMGGNRLQIGESALIEVIKQRTGCERFEHIQGKSPQMVAERMGVMAKVIAGGTIAVDDPVRKIQADDVRRFHHSIVDL